MSLFVRTTSCILCIVLLLPFAGFGQDNVPLGALPMQYNSSFAGSNGGPRISTLLGYEGYKVQYPTPNFIEASRHSYLLATAYDQFIPAIRSGIGFTASMSGDNYNFTSGTSRSDNKPRHASFAIAFAPKFSIKGKYTFSPSFDVTYTNTWNRGNVVYTDSSLVRIDLAFQTISGRAAVLFNSSKYYVGYSVDLVRRTFSYITYINAPLSSKMNQYFNSYLQMGYTFGRSTSKFSFIPQLVLQIHQYPFDKRLRLELESLNLTLRYKKVLWGLNNGGIHVGWQNDKLRLMLTNDLGFIPLRDNSYTSNSISLAFRYLIPSSIQKNYTVPGQ